MAQQQMPVQMPSVDVFAERYGRDPSARPALLVVHPSDIGFMLGKNGSTLKGIEHHTGAVITLVPYTTTFPNVPPHFTIAGNHAATTNAAARLSALANENLRRQWIKSAKTSEVTNTLAIERDDMKMVIGKGGHTIQSINKRYNVRSFTRPDKEDPKNKSVIDIIGYGPDVSAAKKHIWNIVNESMRRRGAPSDLEQKSKKMYKVLKEQEDNATIEKIKQLHATGTTESKKQWKKLYDTVKKTDPELLKRVDDALRTRDGDLCQKNAP